MSDYVEDLLKEDSNEENEQDYNYRRHYFDNKSAEKKIREIPNEIIMDKKESFVNKIVCIIQENEHCDKIENEEFCVLLTILGTPVFVYNKKRQRLNYYKNECRYDTTKKIENLIVSEQLNRMNKNSYSFFDFVNPNVLKDIQNIVKCTFRNPDFVFLRNFSSIVDSNGSVVFIIDTYENEKKVYVKLNFSFDGFWTFLHCDGDEITNIKLNSIDICTDTLKIAQYSNGSYSSEWSFYDVHNDAYFHENLSLICSCEKKPSEWKKSKCACNRPIYYLESTYRYYGYDNLWICCEKCKKEYDLKIYFDNYGKFLIKNGNQPKIHFDTFCKSKSIYPEIKEFTLGCDKKRNCIIEEMSEEDIQIAFKDISENVFGNRLKTVEGKKALNLYFKQTSSKNGKNMKLFIENKVLPILEKKSYAFGTYDERITELEKLKKEYLEYEEDFKKYQLYLEDVPYSLEEDDMFRKEEIKDFFNEEEQVDGLLKNLNENLSQIKRYPFESDLIDGDF